MNKMIHVEPNPPEFDFHKNTVTMRITAEAIDMQNTAIVEACIRAAKEAGITSLFLLDKKFVLDALFEKFDREKDYRNPVKCRYYTENSFWGCGCLATKEIDPCEGVNCKRWQPKEDAHA